MIYIFIASSFILLLFSLYIIQRPWSRKWAKWMFFVSSFGSIIFILLFAFKFKIYQDVPEAFRRTVIISVDVSESTGITINDVKDYALDIFKDYNVEVIPFSDSVPGKLGADSTLLIDSLDKISKYADSKFMDDEIASHIVISDGNETYNIPGLAKKIPGSNNYYINSIYLNHRSKNSTFDKSVFFTKVPRFVPRYEKEKIEFAVNVYGADLKGVPVELKLDGKTLGSVYVEMHDGMGKGTFDIVIKKPSQSLLEASVAVDSREVVSSNNKDYALLESFVDGFRVLHTSGHPSADTASVRSGLQNIPGIDIISFFILRKPGQMNIASESDMSLIPFPTEQLFREEIDNFDIVIINDFKLSDFLPPMYINNIAKFVRNGGGLIIYGGKNSFSGRNSTYSGLKDILPVSPLPGSVWSNETFSVRSTAATVMTPLKGIKFSSENKLQGLNKVEIKDWGTVLYETYNKLPLVAAGIVGKGRVITVLTDSLWRLSYNYGYSSEFFIKSAIRYLLGVSTHPVENDNGKLFFKPDLISKNKEDKDKTYAKIFDRTNRKTIILKQNDEYRINRNELSVFDIEIFTEDRKIDQYKLINYREVNHNEHSFVPMGKDYLKNLSVNSGGIFQSVNKTEIPFAFEKVRIKEPVTVIYKNKKLLPLYYDKLVLLLFLYLAILCFYLKSKYSE